MFDPSTKLREEYFDKLDGKSVDRQHSCTIVRQGFRRKREYPYVRFEQAIVNEHFPQCRNSSRVAVSVILNIFTGFQSSYHKGGKRYPDVISEQILNILRTTPLDLSPSYQVDRVPVLESMAYIEPEEESERVNQKTIQIQHIISTT